MKYVRTKDNIYHITDKECLKTKKENHPLVQIIKESDKLEDLIDNIVIIEPNGIQPFIVGKDINGLEEYAKNNQVFGAIWTYKGLMFVAKMNNKGELELL